MPGFFLLTVKCTYRARGTYMTEVLLSDLTALYPACTCVHTLPAAKLILLLEPEVRVSSLLCVSLWVRPQSNYGSGRQKPEAGGVAQWAECLPSVPKSLGSGPSTAWWHKSVAPTPRRWKAGASEVQSRPQLYSELGSRLLSKQKPKQGEHFVEQKNLYSPGSANGNQTDELPAKEKRR